MEYSAEFDTESNICTLLVTGELYSPRDSFKLQAATIELQTKFECNLFLFDFTQVEIITRTLSAYQTANIEGETAIQLRRLKVGFLYPELTDHERFLETVGFNRGFKVKMFDNRNDALAWLMD